MQYHSLKTLFKIQLRPGNNQLQLAILLYSTGKSEKKYEFFIKYIKRRNPAVNEEQIIFTRGFILLRNGKKLGLGLIKRKQIKIRTM